MLPHIFERFVQADLSSTRVHGGLGLGLAITRHLIELQGGTVTAHSEGEGKGSTFTVTLPLLSEQQEAPALASASSTLESPADCVGRTIVIVDDEFEARELLRGVLEDHGAQVFSAGSAREGFDLVTSCAPDLVISDIAMPYRDGYAFIQEVRNAGLSIPAIALSARAGDSFRHKALETGFNVHLAKPIEMGELLQTITALLREHTRPCSEGLRAHA
jgi:CheY-like chemotaxis protein